MPKVSKATFIVLCSVILFAPSLMAKPPADKGKPGKENSYKLEESFELDASPGLDVLVTAGISFGEARQIAVDHKLTGHKPLPPGIRKNLARGKPLPPGIAKSRMAPGVLDLLPHYEGYEWRMAGSDLILIHLAGHVIADVLLDVFD